MLRERSQNKTNTVSSNLYMKLKQNKPYQTHRFVVIRDGMETGGKLSKGTNFHLQKSYRKY